MSEKRFLWRLSISTLRLVNAAHQSVLQSDQLQVAHRVLSREGERGHSAVPWMQELQNSSPAAIVPALITSEQSKLERSNVISTVLVFFF